MARVESPATPRLSVIVPAGDRPATLPRCVRGIEEAIGPDDELIVVDRPGLGPAGARNQGAAEADGDVLVFIDSDVVVHHDALERLREAFARDGRLAAMFGAYDDEPEARDPVSGFRNLLHHWVHSSGAGVATTFWAGLGAVRRSAFLAIGGFDAERFPRPSVEDIELGARLARSRARIVLDPQVQGTHLKAWSLADMVRTDFARRGVPWAELVIEGAAPADVLNLGWRNRLSALGALLVAIGALRRRPALMAIGIGEVALLNIAFYRLVLERRGGKQALLAVPLHAIHLATASVAVPAAIARRLLGARPGGVR